jgi:hypothetical protein
MAIAIGANTKLAFKKESVYGTNPGGTDWLQLPFTPPLDFGPSQNLEPSDVIGIATNRDAADPFYDAITVDGTVGVPVDKTEFGRWLQLLFGAPTTSNVGADYTHVFKSGGTALPSASIEVGYPDIPRYMLATGVRAGQLDLTLAPTGRPTASIQLLGQAGTYSGSTVDASLTVPASYEQFNNFQGALKRNGSALASITAFRMTFSNGLEPLRTIRADQKIDEALPGETRVSGSLTARFADNTLLGDSEGTTPIAITATLTISAVKSLEFEIPRAFLPRRRARVEGRAGVSFDFDFEASYDGTTAAALQVTLKNQTTAY